MHCNVKQGASIMKKNLFTVMVMLISFPVSAEMSKAEADYYANACFSTVKHN